MGERDGVCFIIGVRILSCGVQWDLAQDPTASVSLSGRDVLWVDMYRDGCDHFGEVQVDCNCPAL